MNILLLEDDLDLSAVASEQIENRGHTVYPALDIEGAKEILKDNDIKVDILIADQRLPDGDGANFAIEMKGSGLPVVVVSGYLNDENITALSDHGVDHYAKPTLYAAIVEDLIEKHYADQA